MTTTIEKSKGLSRVVSSLVIVVVASFILTVDALVVGVSGAVVDAAKGRGVQAGEGEERGITSSYQNGQFQFPQHDDVHPYIPLTHPYRLRERRRRKRRRRSHVENGTDATDNTTTTNTTPAAAGLDVECMLRRVAYDMALLRVPVAKRRHRDEIFQSLQLSDCTDMILQRQDHHHHHQQQQQQHDKLDQQPHEQQQQQKSRRHRRQNNIHDDNHYHHIYLDCNLHQKQTVDRYSRIDTFFNSPHDVMQHVRDLRRRRRRKKKKETVPGGSGAGEGGGGGGGKTDGKQFNNQQQHVIVHIRPGSICFLNETLILDESDMYWVVDDEHDKRDRHGFDFHQNDRQSDDDRKDDFSSSKENTDPTTIFSGGALLHDLRWEYVHPSSQVVVADIPDGINVSSIDGLFAIPKPYRERKRPQQLRQQQQRELHKKNQGHPNNYFWSSSVENQIRLVRARYPNGNPEIDRMPANYDKFSGPAPSQYFRNAWEIAGNVSVRFPNLSKNSSFYPWFGHSLDVRWVQDYHLENASSYYESQTQFWQPRIATAVFFNQSKMMKSTRQRWKDRVSILSGSRRLQEGLNGNDSQSMASSSLLSQCWKSGAVLNIIHYNWWGNWQWELENGDDNGISLPYCSQSGDDDNDEVLLKFGKGGWQDAHGGFVSHNYFFVENILEELDAPGEWFVDKNERKLYYWPLEETKSSTDELLSDWLFVVTQLHTIVTIGTENNQETLLTAYVRNVRLKGITFAHTTTAFLAERYTVPSAGDWSVLPKAAVTISGAFDVLVDHCTWRQVNGNAVAFHGAVHNSTISNGDFIKIGDSGIVLVGILPKDRPYSGVDVKTVPTFIEINKCHFGQTGVFGKQTSALFIALSKGIRFVDNVLYDGPRAGININDGFGGGHVISRNVIFNQVLESGDHGPINTWSRSLYLQKDPNGSVTTTPEWNSIDSNFVMVGPKFGSLYGPGNGPCSNSVPDSRCPKNGGSLFSCLDHDDGSEYYLDTRNVCAFAGMKNYIGQNKIWDSNLIFYPEGAEAQNRSGMSCLWTSMDMAGDKDTLPCSLKPCRTHEVFTNNTCFTTYTQPLEYDMFNETDLALNGITNTTIPLTANNTYYLPSEYNFHGIWNLSQAQMRGVDLGSKEHLIASIRINEMDYLARNLLNIPFE